jgi:phosphohistidine phosphatase
MTAGPPTSPIAFARETGQMRPMGLLILLRHAKAVRDHEAPSDRARGLTGRGRRDAAAAAAAIADQGLKPGALVASSAVRTQETAAIVRDALGLPLTLRDSLYHAGPETIWDEAQTGLARGVIIVGHNPGLHELVATLVGRGGDRSALARRLMDDFPTSAWAAFDVEEAELPSARATLAGGWSPKD